MKRRQKSRAWHREHTEDEFVRRARRQGYRSRAVFKLEELDRKDRLLRPGMCVVDLGAAPGAWSQYAGARLQGRGRIIAVDILPMEPLPGVEVIQGDFTEQALLEQLLRRLGGEPVDLVISDMAPNISGIHVADQAKAIYLAELALDFARQTLRPGGGLLLKTFQGEGFPALQAEMRRHFDRLVCRKPRASRPKSREVYLVGKGRVSV